MITEDYVSFETAKLLKKKGFDGLCITAYETITGEHEVEQCSPSSWGELNQVKRPTLQMAMKWLRENYSIHIIGVPNGIGENVFYMGIYRKYDYGWTYVSDCLDEEYKEAEFYTPEEACEAAIKYCLNLI